MARPRSTPRRTDVATAWGISAVLVLLVGLVYGQTLQFGFLGYDDGGFVSANPRVTAGLTARSIWWAFTDGPFGEWYPLDPLSHMLDCELFGLDARGHHLTNVLLHAATAVALFWVLWRMTGQRAVPGADRRLVGTQASGERAAPAVPSATPASVAQSGKSERRETSRQRGSSATTSLWPSAFVAAVFAVHPQHVESVAWISERRDVLSGLFFVLTLGAYLGYVRRRPALGWYLLVVVLTALGLMAKPMLVTLPALLLLLDFWPLGQIGDAADYPAWTEEVERPDALWLVLEKLPLAALAVGDCWLTMRTHFSAAPPLGIAARLGNAAVSYVEYARQFFLPIDLAAFYPLPPGGYPGWKVAQAVAILAAVTVAVIVWRRRAPYWFVGWFWFLGMLAPVLGLVGVADHARADRYMYLPSIGLSIAATWSVARLAARSFAARASAGLDAGTQAPCWALGLCAGLALMALTAWSAWQASFWSNDAALWAHAIDSTSDNVVAEVGLGYALARDEQFPAAIEHYERALAIQPDSYMAHYHLGTALARLGRFDAAAEHLERAIEINPRDMRAYQGLGHSLCFQQKYDEAQAALEKAVEVAPGSAAARIDLGTALASAGKFDAAIDAYQAALEIDPNSVMAEVSLANALADAGRPNEAAEHYRRALRLDPQNAQAGQRLQQFDAAAAASQEPSRP